VICRDREAKYKTITTENKGLSKTKQKMGGVCTNLFRAKGKGILKKNCERKGKSKFLVIPGKGLRKHCKSEKSHVGWGDNVGRKWKKKAQC